MAEEERDPKVSQRYRDLGREEPPRELDQAILAASRRAGKTRPAPLVPPTGRQRWYFPLAAAAIIVLAVAVTMHVERQRPDPEALPPTAPPSQAKEEFLLKTPPAKPYAPKPRMVPDPKPRADEAPRELRAQRDAARAESQAVPVPAPAAAPSAGARGDVQPMVQAPARARLAGKLAQVESPEQWLERIIELRRQGKHEEADKALAEFKRRYPDYRFTEAMLEKLEKK
jgi:hypothetical protein